jgi:hypothetical protein
MRLVTFWRKSRGSNLGGGKGILQSGNERLETHTTLIAM